jgi:hypothetical protein
MLDFGLCLGEVCPAGPEQSESRASIKASLNNGFLWLSEDDTSLPAPVNNTADTSGGGGSMSIIMLFLLCLWMNVSNGVRSPISRKQLS